MTKKEAKVWIKQHWNLLSGETLTKALLRYFAMKEDEDFAEIIDLRPDELKSL